MLQENALLLLGAVLAVFFISFGLLRKELFSSLDGGRMPSSFARFAGRPLRFFRLAFRSETRWSLSLFYCLTALFGAMSFLLLLREWPLAAALAFFLPLALLIALGFYYALWLGCVLLCRLIDVGDARLNALFSLVVIVTGLTPIAASSRRRSDGVIRRLSGWRYSTSPSAIFLWLRL